MAPLLRLKDNNCHVEESERVLKKHQKFSELIILYEKKGLHRRGIYMCVVFVVHCVYTCSYKAQVRKNY